MRDLCFASATDLIRLYRTRKVSPVEAMEAILAQVDRVNPQLNAIVMLVRESARRAARAATRALSRKAELPLLFGVPVTIKDLVLSTRGLMMATLHAERLSRWQAWMQKGLVWNIEQGLTLTPQEIGRGEKLRTILWQRVRTFFERYDLLILPTVAVKPFPVEEPYPAEINGQPLTNYTQWFFLTYAISLTGLPAISIPCGFTRDGLPVGLQIVGRRRQEASVLKAAAAFERAAPWANRVPSVVRDAPVPIS